MKNTTSLGRVSQAHNTSKQAKVLQANNTSTQGRVSQTHNIISQAKVSQAHSTSSQSRVSQANATPQIHKAVAGKIPNTATNTAKTPNAIFKIPSIANATNATFKIPSTPNTTAINKTSSTANTIPSKATSIVSTAKMTKIATPSISKALKALVFSAFFLNFAAAVELNTICTGGGGSL